MRSWMKWTSSMGAAACLVLAGCDDGPDTGTQDMAMAATGDMATAAGDMAMTPGDMAMAAGDMAMPDMAKTTFSGTMLLQDIVGALPIPGVGVVDVHVLAPTVAFGSSAAPKPDFDKRIPGTPLGCYANWYDLDKQDGPQDDQHDQEVVISGYTGGNLLTGMAAPSAIHCIKGMSDQYYICGYGAPMGPTIGPDPTRTPYPGAAEPMKTGDVINFKGAMASTNFGTFDVNATAQGTLAVTEDLTSGSLFAPGADTVINFTCPDGMGGACGGTAVLVTVVVSSRAQDNAFPGEQYGQIVCAGLAMSGKITIDKDAITTAFGATPADIKTIYTRVVRGTLPAANTDSKMNPLTVAVGRGVFGFATK